MELLLGIIIFMLILALYWIKTGIDTVTKNQIKMNNGLKKIFDKIN